MITMTKKEIINCAINTKKYYDEISTSRIFNKKYELTLIFCFAVAIGFQDNKYESFSKSHPGGLIRTSYIENKTDIQRFIEAIAIIHEKSLNILTDEKRIFEIAECYANGGIKKLYAMVCKNVNEADFDKEVESQMNDMMKNLSNTKE